MLDFLGREGLRLDFYPGEGGIGMNPCDFK